MPEALTWLVLAAGVYNLAFAIFHLGFWRLFRWDDELPRLGSINRAIVQVLNLCLTFLLVLAACALFAFPEDLVSTELGRFLLLGLGAFWFVRAVYQPMFFGIRDALSAVFAAVFMAGALLHLAAWLAARGW